MKNIKKDFSARDVRCESIKMSKELTRKALSIDDHQHLQNKLEELSKKAKSTNNEPAHESDAIKVLSNSIAYKRLNLVNKVERHIESAQIGLHRVDLLASKRFLSKKS